MLILDGKSTAAETRAALKEEIASLLPRAGRAPGLAVILAGDDPASQVYVRNKEKAALEVGMNARTVRLPASVSQNELEDVIAGLNAKGMWTAFCFSFPAPWTGADAAYAASAGKGCGRSYSPQSGTACARSSRLQPVLRPASCVCWIVTAFPPAEKKPWL